MKHKKKILLIDDNADIVEAVTFLLEDAGYEVTASATPEYIEQITKDNLPHLIILDMLLSGQDGRETAKELKGRDLTKHVPIIMISAHPSARETAKKFGADEFIAKPFDIDYLLTRVSRWLS